MIDFIDPSVIPAFAFYHIALLTQIVLIGLLLPFFVALALAPQWPASIRLPFLANLSPTIRIFPLIVLAAVAIEITVYKNSVFSKPISAAEWATLAKAESTLLQIEVGNDIEKTKIAIDDKASKRWIDDLRMHADDNVISYADFLELAIRYNKLDIGTEPTKKWFADNKPDVIRKELKNAMMSINDAPTQQSALPTRPDVAESAKPARPDQQAPQQPAPTEDELAASAFARSLG